MIVDDLIKRYKRLKDRGTWEETWQEITDYVLPRKSDVQVKRSPGEKRTNKLFDSTAIHSNELLAASLQGSLTNSSTTWVRLRARESGLNEIADVKFWLQDSATRMIQAFNRSNFNSEVHEHYLDLGSIGTGALFLEGNNGFVFKALFISEYYIEESSDGMVNAIFRVIEYTPRQAFEKWGKDIGEKLLEMYNTSPDKKITILHAILPRKDGDVQGKLKTNLPFASYYVDLKHKHLISEGGYHEFPVMVPRWTKVTGEKYGRSPSFTALPDIKTMNKAVELELKAWAKDIDPPFVGPDEGITGEFSLTPGTMNYVRFDLVDKVRPLESGHRYDVSRLKFDELKKSIRQIYFSDQLQLQSGPQMTATEVQVRFELMQRLLGPTLGRLESELLNPLINRAFQMMLRADEFLSPPKELEGQELDIEYVGPLARSQKLSEVQSIRDYVETIGGISGMKPDIVDNIDSDFIAIEVQRLLGVNPKVLMDKDDVKDLRDTRNQAQQTQEDLETAKNVKEIASE